MSPTHDPIPIDPTPRALGGWDFGGAGEVIVVAIAELGANGLWFADFAQVADATYRFVAPDLSGHVSRSSTPGTTGHLIDPTPKERGLPTSARLAGFIDRFEEPVMVAVGHGFGANAALGLGRERADRIAGVLTLDGPRPVESHPERETGGGAGSDDLSVLALGRTFPQRNQFFEALIEAGRLPDRGMSRNLRRAVEAEIAGSGFAWQPRLSVERARQLLDEIAGYRPSMATGVPIRSIVARHGSRRGDPPIVLADRPSAAREIDTTHYGLLWDRDALGECATDLSSFIAELVSHHHAKAGFSAHPTGRDTPRRH